MSDILKQTLFSVAHEKSPTEVVISGGLAEGITGGSRFLLFREGPKIIDPETGQDLGVLEHVLGQAVVTHAQEHMSTVISSLKEKKPDKKRIFDYRSESSSVAAARAFMGSREPKEEITVGETVIAPFVSIEVGDKARKVG